jgi:hypothetical protein
VKYHQNRRIKTLYLPENEGNRETERLPDLPYSQPFPIGNIGNIGNIGKKWVLIINALRVIFSPTKPIFLTN